jgi:hypothetical protein
VNPSETREARHRELKLTASSGSIFNRRKISFSQGAEWKALISRYIGAIPLSGDAPPIEHNASGDPAPRTPVSSAMIAKVGAAARVRKSTAFVAAARRPTSAAQERASLVSPLPRATRVVEGK